MNFSERESVITQICCGRYFIDLYNRLYVYVEPTDQLMWQSQQRYHDFLREYADTGQFFSEKEADKYARKIGVWDDQDEQAERICKDNLKKLKQERPAYSFQSGQLAQIDRTIQITEEELQKLAKRKNTFTHQTLEYQSRQQQYSWLLAHCLFDKYMRPIWGSYEAFEEQCELSIIRELIGLIFYRGVFTEKELRAIARSEPWRTKWKTAQKLSLPVFHDGIYGPMQFQLSYWSNIYDSVYESMECPAQSVIEDDERLNIWLESQSQKFEDRQKEKGKETLPITRNPKIANAQEIFVKVDSAKDAQKVYSTLNTPQTRRLIRTRQQALKKRPVVKEQELPDVQKDLQMKLTDMRRQHIKGKK